jgi:hypothetical protein
LLWSYLLLQAGFDRMAVRYPLAPGGAYVVFIFLLWLWLRTKAGDCCDAGNALDWFRGRRSGGASLSSPNLHSDYSGHGGCSGGGGSAGRSRTPTA